MSLIRLVKEVEGNEPTYYLLVPGETGPDQIVETWEAHEVSERKLGQLKGKIEREVVEPE